MAPERVSVGRVRIGILLFILWWLPFYLLAPAIAGLLGQGDDAQARRAITISIVCIQTVLGLIGAYLAGRELFATLAKVRRPRLLPVAWRIVWSGDTHVDDRDLKKPEPEVARAGDAPAGSSHPAGTRPAPSPAGSVDARTPRRAAPDDKDHQS